MTESHMRSRFLILMFGLLVRINLPIAVNPGLIHDDALMVYQASSLINGEWLGSWEGLEDRLLAKSPGFQIFLALGSFLPWSQVTTIFLIFLLALVLVARELDFIFKNRRVGTILIAVTVFNPVFYGVQASRVYRDFFLASLVFLLLGICLTLLRVFLKASEVGQFNTHLKIKLMVIASTLGLILGIIHVTKISWYHALFLAFGTNLAILLLSKFKNQLNLKVVYSILLLNVFIYFFAAIPKFLIENQNQNKYGVALVEDFGYGEYAEAMQVWSSVISQTPSDFSVIDKSMREQVYQISVVANQMKPYLDGRGLVNWEQISCSSTGICDSTGLWFFWDVRDAARESGLANSPIQFQETFKKLKNEISDACNSEILKCGMNSLAPMTLPLDKISEKRLVDSLGTAFNQVFNLSSAVATVPEQLQGDAPSSEVWQSTVNGISYASSKYLYGSNDLSFGDLYQAWVETYRIFWNLAIIISVIAVFSGLALRGLTSGNYFEIFPILLLATGTLLLVIFQLALVQASSGVLLDLGGALYLLPVYPLLSVVILLILFLAYANIRNRFESYSKQLKSNI